MKRFLRKIVRVFQFIPVIWRTDDWDYRHAIDLFQYQLSRLANYIEKNERHEDYENDVSKIRTAIQLMQKVYDEDYSLEYLEQMEELYGKGICDIVWSKPNVNGFYTGTNMCKGRENEKEIQDKYFELFKQSQNKQEKAHRILWQFIAHNIRGWWD